MTVSCPAGHTALEAFVYVTQDGYTSPFRSVPVRCNGRSRTYRVQVPAPYEQPFHSGAAQISGYVLVTDGDETASASPVQQITIVARSG
jgi:hypothetical protein